MTVSYFLQNYYYFRNLAVMEELKLQTPVPASRGSVGLSTDDAIFVLGSCFADNIGRKMTELGLEACVNPFGTLYNPVSVCNSAARLQSCVHFTEDECAGMGAGSDLICSFSHHTTFARPTKEEFLSNANKALDAASDAWKKAGKVIITLGTAWCFEHGRTGETVANCLKVDPREFSRRKLSVSETAILLKNLVAHFPEKGFIFTVSPIRHLKDGAHGNQLSKATLLLAIDETCRAFPDRTDYFPAYEIVLDELRDYRFYAPDMVHPSSQAIDYLWARFAGWAFTETGLKELESREKDLLRSRHRPIVRE